MQKWLAVSVLTLAALVAAMGARNLTVKASSSSDQPVLVAWGGAPVPPTSWAKWGGAPVPPSKWVKWGGAPVPPSKWVNWGGAPVPPSKW